MHTEFVSYVRMQATAYGDGRAYTYYREVGLDLFEEVHTFRELDRRARATAAWLGGQPEADRPVLLLYVDAIDFLPAFLGCLYAGVVAVPAPLPHDAESRRRLAGMLDDADIGMVLTTSGVGDLVTSWLRDNGRAGTVSWVSTDSGRLGDADAWRMPELGGDTVAFLQYTSGSTSEPKGVVVTHGNLLHNEGTITEAIGIDDSSTGVSWLPHFHDMGLIGMLAAIYAGADLVMMSPLAFLKRPVRWLELIDRHGAQFTVAPNFAYDLVARRVTDAQLAGLDLSSLKVALNGAEPVRSRTLDAVVDRLGTAGFPAAAFTAAYGMAEVTLLATAGEIAAPPRTIDVDAAALEHHEAVPCTGDRGVRLVSCGRPRDLDIRIVDPDTGIALPDNRVGEVWIRGSSVTAGYWNRPDETDERFGAHLGGEGPFLRTGDLGLRHRDELFVTGRLTDLLIVNGRNLYPQDVEEVVREVHPALEAAAGVAFSVETGDRERLLVIQEVRTSLLAGLAPADLAALIKIAVARHFDVPAPDVVLLDRRGVHRTTSGKVQRRAMRKSFLADAFTPLHEDLTPTVQRLRATV
ncbi:fatty acyl-AMP ligase [Rhodococcus sp. NPDC059234]|uniref:fatty acyl-AMP ligase n=1 Tax=Rhodococcus sp. NPDC059234 TaxID=3346781 RepID=UPI00366E8850